jgi:hypothetical protein
MRPISELVKEAFSRGLRFGTASALRAAVRVADEARTLGEVREVVRKLLEQHEAAEMAERAVRP